MRVTAREMLSLFAARVFCRATNFFSRVTKLEHDATEANSGWWSLFGSSVEHEVNTIKARHERERAAAMRREAAEKQQELNVLLKPTHDRNFKGIINDMKNLPLKAKYSKYWT